MLSRIPAFARPVRTVASSLRKSSTAFSIRVLAAAIASLVVAIVIVASSPSQKLQTTLSSKYRVASSALLLSHLDFLATQTVQVTTRAPFSIFTFPFSMQRDSRRPYRRTHALAHHH